VNIGTLEVRRAFDIFGFLDFHALFLLVFLSQLEVKNLYSLLLLNIHLDFVLTVYVSLKKNSVGYEVSAFDIDKLDDFFLDKIYRLRVKNFKAS
jgi:hypothetical protein